MRVAAIGPRARLVVIQFLVKSNRVPPVVPFCRNHGNSPNLPNVPGKEVLPSTRDVYLLNLLDGIIPITGSGSYELVDAWFKVVPLGKAKVRYVFCHKDHVRTGKLHPEFIAKRDELIDSLVNLASDNLWTIQGHLNPYFDNGQPSGDEVLMFGCAGRSDILDPLGMVVRVWSGGKDHLGQGIGARVPITEVRPKLKVVEGEVVLQP